VLFVLVSSDLIFIPHEWLLAFSPPQIQSLGWLTWFKIPLALADMFRPLFTLLVVVSPFGNRVAPSLVVFCPTHRFSNSVELQSI
jgi:hypothetical protein